MLRSTRSINLNLQLIMYPGKLAEAKKNGVVPKVDPDAAPDADSELIDGATGDGDSKDPAIDPERDESLNILADLVQLSNGPEHRQHESLSERRRQSCLPNAL